MRVLVFLLIALLGLMVIAQNEVALLLQREPLGERVDPIKQLAAHPFVMYREALAVTPKLLKMTVA